MKLRVFQSDKGDCLLLTSSDGEHMLIDGGMKKSFNQHTASYLSRYVDRLHRVCVTHIDQDHILGILELCEHVLDWRVYAYQQSVGNIRFKEPESPEPPPITAFWHNSFSAQFGEEADNLAMVASTLSTIFSVGEDINSQELAHHLSEIATSQRQGYLLTQKIGPALLNIPVNPEFGGELMLFDPNNNVFPLGNTTIRMIAPFAEDINKLRNEWKEWVESADGKKAVKKINDTIKRDGENLDSSNATNIQSALKTTLSSVRLELGKKYGNRKKVTTPNLASTMFVAEEGNKKILFTGDGHGDDIDKGLEADGTYDPKSGVHFDIIKVPHHGSEFNTDLDFWRRMTADDYVFCSDGSHHNPDIGILERIIQSRKEDKDKNLPHANRNYKLWFNSSVDATKSGNKSYMKKIRSFVRREARLSNGRLSYQFLSGHGFRVRV